MTSSSNVHESQSLDHLEVLKNRSLKIDILYKTDTINIEDLCFEICRKKSEMSNNNQKKLKLIDLLTSVI